MPYPSKTDRQTILSAAVKELARKGIRDLSLRNLAASLDLAPNAIYRYFSDRSALETALANEAARQLELALRKASDGCEPVTTIREMSSAYMKFARDNRHLYEVMMSLHAPDHDATSRQSLWAFTVEQVQRIAGSDRAAQASVALWAFLHGAVTLEAAQVFGENKPVSGLEFGLDAWLMAVAEGVKATVKVFQYGSNCSVSEINNESRLKGDAKVIDIAETVEAFELAFDVWSTKRGCAASDIIARPGHKVWGVLYDVPEYLMSKDTAGQQGRRSFDEIEGKKYKREKILVRRPGGEVVEAITYRVITPETGKKTNLAYVGYIIRGLRERGVGETYISRVKEIAAKNNPELAEAVNGL